MAAAGGRGAAGAGDQIGSGLTASHPTARCRPHRRPQPRSRRSCGPCAANGCCRRARCCWRWRSDRLGLDRITPDSPVQAPPAPSAPIEAQLRALRRKWLLPAGAVLLALAISAVLWNTLHSKPKLVALADQPNVPLISVMTPGLKAVTSSVSFTGAITARYDMPIGNDGETGRIVAVYVEPGDHVQRGQPLAKLDQSVLIPQLNRLAAALEQAQAQAALSAAEYRRAQGVESAGALSAEDIEKRRATAVTDAANVKVAAALLAEGEARLNRTRIVAPIAGTVLTRRAEVGQIASPGGEALFRIASGGEDRKST